MKKGFIFDLDGVIVDTAKFHFLAWQRCAHSLDIAFDENDNEHLKGVSRNESLKWILNKGNKTLNEAEFLQKTEEKNNWYREYISGMTETDVLEGVVPFLNKAQSLGIKLAIASSSKNAPLILERVGLTNRFQNITDGNQITHSKPHPEVFLKAAAGIGLEPNDCVVFEDAQAGVKGGVDGGFYTVGIGDAQTLEQAHQVVPNLLLLDPETL